MADPSSTDAQHDEGEDMTSTTLRLNMPQWQGGNEPAYRFGAELLAFLAPPADGPEETIDVPYPEEGTTLKTDAGIVGRVALLSQARAARAAIDRHSPERIVALGGDCLIDLAPIAYLNERYGGKLGVLWVDSHPDVMRTEHFSHAHAHVLGMLMGEGDPDFVGEVKVPVDPARVMYAGLDDWNDVEGQIIRRLQLRYAGADALAETSQLVLDWIAAQTITHLAVHFALDVLDPAHFAPLLFNRPSVTEDIFAGIPQGRMRLDQVVRLLNDAAGATDMVGLAITEHLPWDMLELRNALHKLPLLA
jgi:arginase